MADNMLETRLLLQRAGYDEYDIDEIIDDYLPDIKRHIGFRDERSDKRFVVKFHDILYFTNTDGDDKDMDEEEFDRLFESFCEFMYDGVECLIREQCLLTERQLFRTGDVGHYQAFEYIQEEKVTEDNVLDIATEIFDNALSPYYFDDYVKIVNYLQDMEDNYVEYWLDFLRDGEYVDETTIKKIERRVEEYRAKHNPKK